MHGVLSGIAVSRVAYFVTTFEACMGFWFPCMRLESHQVEPHLVAMRLLQQDLVPSDGAQLLMRQIPVACMHETP